MTWALLVCCGNTSQSVVCELRLGISSGGKTVKGFPRWGEFELTWVRGGPGSRSDGFPFPTLYPLRYGVHPFVSITFSIKYLVTTLSYTVLYFCYPTKSGAMTSQLMYSVRRLSLNCNEHCSGKWRKIQKKVMETILQNSFLRDGDTFLLKLSWKFQARFEADFFTSDLIKTLP